MSEQKAQKAYSGGVETTVPYEAPRLIVLGNARDLLAGGSGSQDDASCGEATIPTKTAGESC
jgi:hypothetical protein